VDVPVELVASPTCRLDFDPTSLDYFPLERGTRWTYLYNDNGSSSQQHWEVTYDSGCNGGSRTFRISGMYPAWELEARGDSLIPRSSEAPKMRRYYPAASSPPETIWYSWGLGGSGVRLQRDVGVSYRMIEARGLPGQFFSWSWTLTDGPIPPP
jgi:hypothetical protein